MPVEALVDVVNLALVALGSEPIVSLADAANDPDQAGPREAVIMRTLYAPTRDDVFVLHPWNALIRRAELVESPPVPVFGYGHAFPLPQGGVGDPAPPPYCLRVIDTDLDGTWPWSGWWGWDGWSEAWGSSPDGLWRIEGRSIVTDSTTIKVRYIGLELDVTTYPPHLVTLLAARLAWKGAQALDKGAATVDMKAKEYQAALYAARRVDGQEHGPRIVRSTALTSCR